MPDDTTAQRARLRLIGDIVGALAHDFGQPLNIIRLSAENGLDTCDDEAGEDGGAGLRRGLTVIGEQAERLQATMAHLVAVARGGAGARDLDPVAAVEAVLARLRPRCAAEGVALDWRPAPCPPLRAVPAQLALVLETVLTNAFDAVLNVRMTRPAEGIAVTCRPENGGVALTVADDGNGMPAGVVEGVLHPLALAERGGGRPGIGLLLTAGIVAEMAGRLDIQARPGGTRVTVWLPTAGGIKA